MASGYPGHQPDRGVLAGRIQGFGNNNPPPLEDPKGAEVAKKALGRLGGLMGEEVMLTVDDFREKGAVGAVKDAVADAGDILIDGVSGLVGWIRGDPPPEDDGGAAAEFANQCLSNGPSGAAYGVSQASPTGGINAVWVMPEDADPVALSSLTQQTGSSFMSQSQDPRVPNNIQPYEAPASRNPSVMSFTQGPPLSIPGGPVIAPYEPAPSGPGAGQPPYVPRSFSSSSYSGAPSDIQTSRWGPAGYSASSGSGGAASSASKALVERISKGEVLVGADVAKRLASQCSATGTTAKQLAEMICERARRLYLGLDGSDPADADVALMHLLGLADFLRLLGTDFAAEAVRETTANASEELLSLRSSAKHKDAAELLLRNLSLLGKAPMTCQASSHDMPDLLGGGSEAAAASSQVKTDLMGGAAAPAGESDLLGGASACASVEADLLGSATAAAPAEADLLGDVGQSSHATDLLGSISTPATEANLLDSGCVSSSSQATSAIVLDPMLSTDHTSTAVASGSDPLAGLTIESSACTGIAAASNDCSSAAGSDITAGEGLTSTATASAADVASHAALDSMEAERSHKSKGDAFGFVGDEICKAQTGGQA